MTGTLQGDYSLRLRGLDNTGRVWQQFNGDTNTADYVGPGYGEFRPYTDGPWTPGNSDTGYQGPGTILNYVPCKAGFDVRLLRF